MNMDIWYDENGYQAKMPVHDSCLSSEPFTSFQHSMKPIILTPLLKTKP